MFNEKPKISFEGNDEKYKDFLLCCAQEASFVYFFEIIKSLNSEKIFNTNQLDECKNKVFNAVISKYLQESNIQDPDFLNVKNFILSHNFGQSKDIGNQMQNQLMDLLGTRETIIKKLDEKAEFIRNLLIAIKNKILKASLEKIDFEKIFEQLWDEYIERLFVSTNFQPIFKEIINNKIRALMRSYYNGATLFEYYFKNYSSACQQVLA